MNDFAFSRVWTLRVILLRAKCTAKFFNGVLPNSILHVEIMLRHIYISMSHDTLDGCQDNTEGLHLTITAVVELYFSDLTEEAQERYLDAMGIMCPEEANLDADIVPIASIETDS